MYLIDLINEFSRYIDRYRMFVVSCVFCGIININFYIKYKCGDYRVFFNFYIFFYEYLIIFNYWRYL